MTYQELMKYLELNHFYFSPTIKIGKGKGETIVDLYMYTPPILGNDRVKRLKEILPEGFDCYYMPNTMNVYIKKIEA